MLAISRRHVVAGALFLPVIGKAAAPLRVGAALPDPPFEFMANIGPVGFDITLMRRIAEKLGREWQLVPFKGSNFDDIFHGLDTDTYDCVASGTTITPAREAIADFCAPYAVSGQSLIVDFTRHPNVHGIADLKGAGDRGAARQHQPAGGRKAGGRASGRPGARSMPMTRSNWHSTTSRPADATPS